MSLKYSSQQCSKVNVVKMNESTIGQIKLFTIKKIVLSNWSQYKMVSIRVFFSHSPTNSPPMHDRSGWEPKLLPCRFFTHIDRQTDWYRGWVTSFSRDTLHREYLIIMTKNLILSGTYCHIIGLILVELAVNCNQILLACRLIESFGYCYHFYVGL